jgi:hypothetical protein
MKHMKDKFNIAAGTNPRRQSDTQQEIRDFMRALSSYPEQFAHDPCLSFEQHLFSIASSSNATGQGSGESYAGRN